jgi:hypothetical protein
MLKNLKKLLGISKNLDAKKKKLRDDIAEIEKLIGKLELNLTDGIINSSEDVGEIRNDISINKDKLKELNLELNDILFAEKNVNKSRSIKKLREELYNECVDEKSKIVAEIQQEIEKKLKAFEIAYNCEKRMEILRNEAKLIDNDYELVVPKKERKSLIIGRLVDYTTFEEFCNTKRKQEPDYQDEFIRRTKVRINAQSEISKVIAENAKEEMLKQQQYEQQLQENAKKKVLENNKAMIEEYKKRGIDVNEKIGTT